MTGSHAISLSQDHILGKAREVRISTLSLHLALHHGVSARGPHVTKGELGRRHLLAHAVNAYPELRELLGLDSEWGKW